MGWKTCYSEESNHTTRYTLDEVVQAVKAGATVEKEVGLVTKSVFININGKAMLFRQATEEELAEQRKAEEQARYERAIKKIHARNRAKARR